MITYKPQAAPPRPHRTRVLRMMSDRIADRFMASAVAAERELDGLGKAVGPS